MLSGELDLDRLPEDDEEAIALLTQIKGIGRWSAEIYLLFAEGRTDVWPAGDLAVQIEIGKLLGLEGKPTEKQLRELGEAWRPHRGAVAVLAWHSYNSAGPLDCECPFRSGGRPGPSSRARPGRAGAGQLFARRWRSGRP